MSDQPGIPAIMVFPPFSPAPRKAEPGPAPAESRDQAPPAEPPPAAPAAPPAPAAPAAWDSAAPASPAPWDFEAPAEPARAEAGETAPEMDDDEDLPWLEVPAPAPPAAEPTPSPEASDAGLKADDTPSWMDWVRDGADAAPAADEEPDATPIADLAPADAQPWSPETETAADDWAAAPEASPEPWRAPEAEAGDPWQAPGPEAPAADWPASDGNLDLPEELYDLPGVPPSDSPWSDSSAPAAAEADGPEAEPAWELPSQSAPDEPLAWESFAAAEPASESTPSESAAGRSDGGAFAAVADRLQAIADALRADPGAFLSGAQGGGDPLALLVAGFVMGYNARQGGGS